MIRLLARATTSAAALLTGVSVGMVIERNREFGTEYWKSNAQQAWQLRSESPHGPSTEEAVEIGQWRSHVEAGALRQAAEELPLGPQCSPRSWLIDRAAELLTR